MFSQYEMLYGERLTVQPTDSAAVRRYYCLLNGETMDGVLYLRQLHVSVVR